MIPLQTNSRNASGILPSTAKKIRSSRGIFRVKRRNPSGESGYRLPFGFLTRYQLAFPSARLESTEAFSISSASQYSALTSGCLSTSMTTAVFLPVPGRPLKAIARWSCSASSITSVLSILTSRRCISFTPFRQENGLNDPSHPARFPSISTICPFF